MSSKALGAESFGTIWLVLAGCGSAVLAAAFPEVAIGLALTLVHLISIPVTGTSVSPARSISQAIFAGGPYIAQLWLLVVAPVSGAALGGVVHRWLGDTGDALIEGRSTAPQPTTAS